MVEVLPPGGVKDHLGFGCNYRWGWSHFLRRIDVQVLLSSTMTKLSEFWILANAIYCEMSRTSRPQSLNYH